MRLEGTIEIPYRWATGRATGQFLEGLATGRLLGSRCGGCSRVLVPAIGYCTACGQDTLDELVPVGPEGVVRLALPVHQSPPCSPFGAPYTLVMVQLDGADSTLLHRLCGTESVAQSGDRVRAVFGDTERGDFGDLAGFELLELSR